MRKRPQLLFLDEATSHLDAVMEMSINNNLAKLSMTKIIIAHRQETIASADIVLALTQGELRDISQQIKTTVFNNKHQYKENNDEHDFTNSNTFKT